MIVATTERLIIRTWKPDDIADYAHIVSDPEVMKFIGEGNPLTYEEATKYIKNCMVNIALQGWARFAVELKESKELIGFCGFADYDNEIDFGWRYAKKHWNKGYGTEAAHAVLGLGLNKFRFPRIVCIAYKANRASIKIIEKIGMEFEKNISIHNRDALQYIKLNPSMQR